MVYDFFVPPKTVNDYTLSLRLATVFLFLAQGLTYFLSPKFALEKQQNLQSIKSDVVHSATLNLFFLLAVLFSGLLLWSLSKIYEVNFLSDLLTDIPLFILVPVILAQLINSFNSSIIGALVMTGNFYEVAKNSFYAAMSVFFLAVFMASFSMVSLVSVPFLVAVIVYLCRNSFSFKKIFKAGSLV